MASDAVNKAPTLDEQLGAFKGFSAENGEIVGSTSAKAIAAAQEPAKAVTKPLTAAERLAAFEKPTKDDDADEGAADEPAEGAAEEGEEEGEGEEDDPPAERTTKPKSADKRIAQAVGRQRAAERRAELAERQLSDLAARMTRLESGNLTPQPQRANNATSDIGTPPDPSEYQYGELDVKFIADTARYETLKTLAEQDTRRAAQAQQQRQAAGQTAMAEKYREFESEGLARYDDFDEVVTAGAQRGDWPLSPMLASLLLDSENGTDIAYHLATNRKEAKRVFELTPAQQAKWFGQRDAVLSSDAPGAHNVAKRVSNAPDVPRREARGNGSRQQVSPDTADFAAFERLANKR